mgnify:FL=1
MKVLSLTEPFASLIGANIKHIETRSWKTSYRGELYIHASQTKIPKVWRENKELMALVENIPLNYGYIICKCKLVDCVYMTESFINDLKKNNKNEYSLGIYKVGRYAWTLEDITPIDKIKTKGKLGIWTY